MPQLIYDILASEISLFRTEVKNLDVCLKGYSNNNIIICELKLENIVLKEQINELQTHCYDAAQCFSNTALKYQMYQKILIVTIPKAIDFKFDKNKVDRLLF